MFDCHGLPVFASGLPLQSRPNANFGKPWNLIHSLPCRTPCIFLIHEISFGPLSLHLLVSWTWMVSVLFLPMRAFKLQWSRAFNLVCKVALSFKTSWTRPLEICGVYVNSSITKVTMQILFMTWNWYNSNDCTSETTWETLN